MSVAVIEGGKVELVLLSKEEIKKGQDSIRKRLTNIDGDIHANAVQCLMHCEKHRDTSLMRRLLVDIIDDKTGYRRQGLIAWMRAFSPMELKGKEINLSGKKDGVERPFDIETAAKTPLWEVSREVALVKPMYRDTLMSPISRAIKDFRAAMDNTQDGKAIDPTKPFYDGIHSDKVLDFFEAVEKLQLALPKDSTREVRQAQETIRKAVGDDETARKALREAVG